ncbi:hypothetical protein B0T19DRAFT_400785 [Cercophora scortea]|uniref:Nicotinamide N-methyltransferase n=1 Tax=Cercophora scortea TaxID=314031 RepID=A0AAE0IN05_9PEZI|nr:hypothetical protein B0T19DRAFT_400785 [Cercophora scortea]
MSLIARIALTGPPAEDPEDFFCASLSVIFPDDVTNQHGDSEHGLLYTSPHLPEPLNISLAEPSGDTERELFSHYLWNSSLMLAETIEAGTLGLDLSSGSSSSLPSQSQSKLSQENGASPIASPASDFNITGLSTIELGAGTALPSIMSALLGAHRVVVTDYPAPVVIETLRRNVAVNVQPSLAPSGALAEGQVVEVEGHGWGELDSPVAQANKHAFDRVMAADCLWMPWQHANLLRSVDWFLGQGPTARAWVIAGFHTGRDKLSRFFVKETLAEKGLEVERIWERDCDGKDREWSWDRGIEDVSERKRWLVIAVLRRVL